jgi:hypothetical protein
LAALRLQTDTDVLQALRKDVVRRQKHCLSLKVKGVVVGMGASRLNGPRRKLVGVGKSQSPRWYRQQNK